MQETVSDGTSAKADQAMEEAFADKEVRVLL